MSHRQKRNLKSLNDVTADHSYTTGEVRDLFKSIGLPYSKPWLYDLIKEDQAVNRLFTRPALGGYRYISGDNLTRLVAWLQGRGDI